MTFKLATGFTVDDIEPLIRNAQKNAATLPEGEPFVLKGNPPPRFAKKAAPAAADAAPVEGAAAEAAPAEPPAG